MTLFDCLKEIITTKRGTLDKSPYFDKSWNTFMILRYLSMDNKFAKIARLANSLQCTLTNVQMYKYLVKNVPYSRNSYIRYISKPKTKSKKK